MRHQLQVHNPGFATSGPLKWRKSALVHLKNGCFDGRDERLPRSRFPPRRNSGVQPRICDIRPAEMAQIGSCAPELVKVASYVADVTCAVFFGD